MKRSHLWAVMPKVFLAAVSILAVLASACTPAQVQQLEGLLQNVDTVNGTVTVTTKDGKTVTLTINNNTVTMVDGSNTTVFNLEPGAKVKIETEGGVARSIADESASVEGTISAVQGGQVTVRRQSGADVAVNVTAQTSIRLEGDRTGSLSDLKVGLRVVVKYDLQTMNAIRVMLNTRQKTEVEGTITAISGNNVTISTKVGLQATIIVDSNTSIRLERGATGVLGDLKVGMKAHARFDPSTKIATRVEVQGKSESESRGKD